MRSECASWSSRTRRSSRSSCARPARGGPRRGRRRAAARTRSGWPRAPVRRDRARRDAARPRRLRDLPRAAPRGIWTPVLMLTARDAVADRVDGPRRRRRRLPRQAVLLRRAARAPARARAAAPGRAPDRARGRRPAPRPGGAPRLARRRRARASRRRSSRCSSSSCADPGDALPGPAARRRLGHGLREPLERRRRLRPLPAREDRPAVRPRSLETVRGVGYRLRAEDAGMSSLPIRVRLTLAVRAGDGARARRDRRLRLPPRRGRAAHERRPDLARAGCRGGATRTRGPALLDTDARRADARASCWTGTARVVDQRGSAGSRRFLERMRAACSPDGVADEGRHVGLAGRLAARGAGPVRRNRRSSWSPGRSSEREETLHRLERVPCRGPARCSCSRSSPATAWPRRRCGRSRRCAGRRPRSRPRRRAAGCPCREPRRDLAPRHDAERDARLASRPRSSTSGDSSPTRATSCARRSRCCARSSSSRCAGRARARSWRARSGRPPRRPSG